MGVQRHDIDQLVTHTDAALDVAQQTGSGYIVRKLHSLRPHFASVMSDNRVRDLDREIMRLTGASAVYR